MHIQLNFSRIDLLLNAPWEFSMNLFARVCVISFIFLIIMWLQWLQKKAYKHYIKSRSAMYFEKYRYIRRRHGNLLHREFTRKIRRISSMLLNESKQFYKYIASGRKDQACIPPVMYYNDEELNTITEIQNAFINHFKKATAGTISNVDPIDLYLEHYNNQHYHLWNAYLKPK